VKWDFQIALTIRRGRKRVFRIEQFLPFLRRFRDAHYQHARSCYDKSRFHSRESAMNAEWFKKNPDQAYPHEAYLCEVCDGWHLTTVREEKKNGSIRSDVRA
jgi:hypothetical protein